VGWEEGSVYKRPPSRIGEINSVLTIRAPSSLMKVEVGEEASNSMLAEVSHL